jgi:DNA primase large subunit
MYDLATYVKYPFLKAASNYIKTAGPTLRELLYEPAYGSARALGKRRLLQVLETGALARGDVSTEAKQLLELLGYIVTRILVSCVNDRWLLGRYAVAESKLFYEEILRADLGFAVGVIAGEVGVKDAVASSEGAIRIHLTDYLRAGTAFRDPRWKLVNRKLEGGYVELGRREFCRLLQEYLYQKFLGELPLAVNEELQRVFAEDVRELKARLAERKVTREYVLPAQIRTQNFPPCIQKILAKLAAGENVPHMARFALTTFLGNIGMSNEDILAIFRQSPDFDQRKALYQIDHITGKISGTKYTAPRCATMRTYGVCAAGDDALCAKEWLTHPLSYYRVKSRSRASAQEQVRV